MDWLNSVTNLEALTYVKGRIRKATVQEIRDMIQHVWQELEYQLDIRQVMSSAHVETCYVQNYLRHISN